MTVHPTEATDPDTSRQVALRRQRKARYLATNRRGGSIEVGEGDDAAFTPVELLLTALASCTAMDVDYIVGKRAEAESGRLTSSGRKVRDAEGNHLVDLEVVLDLHYPEGAQGDAARAALPMAVERSTNRLCTVSRTVQLGTPVRTSLAGSSERSDD
jgi:putative redox protein